MGKRVVVRANRGDQAEMGAMVVIKQNKTTKLDKDCLSYLASVPKMIL